MLLRLGPEAAGRNLADYSTWTGWLGGFVPPDARTGDYAALYNRDADEGMVRVGPPPSAAQGLKIFGFGPRFDPHTYTDDDSSYAELWGGLLPTFWDTTPLAPGATVGWAERWQPVAHLGGVRYANAWGVINRRGDQIVLTPARLAGGQVVVRRDGAEVARRQFELLPGATLAVDAPGGALDVEVLDAGGHSVLRALLP